MSRNKNKGIVMRHNTSPDTWKEILDVLGQIPEIEVVSNVNNDKVTALNFKVTGYRGLKFIRDAFTAGWQDQTGVIAWESYLWDSQYKPNDDAVYIHASFKVMEGEVDGACRHIYLFFSLRDMMRIAKRRFGLFKDKVD